MQAADAWTKILRIALIHAPKAVAAIVYIVMQFASEKRDGIRGMRSGPVVWASWCFGGPRWTTHWYVPLLASCGEGAAIVAPVDGRFSHDGQADSDHRAISSYERGQAVEEFKVQAEMVRIMSVGLGTES